MDKDKVREAARELVQMLKLNEYRGVNTSLTMEVTKEFRALKEALKPSKEEVANKLEILARSYVAQKGNSTVEFLDHAIEYLKEE